MLRLLCASIFALVLLPSVQAATFTAASSLDAPDANPGNGVCDPVGLPPSQCTLRAAIMEASALPGSHTIQLQSGRVYLLTRPQVGHDGSNGALRIGRSMSISCPGCTQRPVLDANFNSLAVRIVEGDVTLTGFDIVNGMNSPNAVGGGVLVEFGAGVVRLNAMRLIGNAGFVGGGIYSDGPDTRVTGSELAFNEAFSGIGAAIRFTGEGTFRLFESAVHANIGSSAVSAWATNVGSGPLLIQDSTISGNDGAAVVVQRRHLSLRNATVVANGGNGLQHGGADGPWQLTLRNSILAGNGSDCAISPGNVSVDADGHNLLRDASCFDLPGVSNLRGVDPLLTPLRYRSGLSVTPIHWPRRDSPAMSAGSPNLLGDGACTGADQHGTTRPHGYGGPVRCDIGAAEVDAGDVIHYDSNETVDM